MGPGGYRAGDFPHSERAANETLALPIYPELTDEMQAAIQDTLHEFPRPNQQDGEGLRSFPMQCCAGDAGMTFA